MQEKIQLKDIHYFASQHKVISLYDALISYGYANTHKNQLLEIASMLYKPSASINIPKYDADEWFDVGFWGGPIPCSSKTADFIKSVNVKNRDIYRQYKLEIITKALAEDDIDSIINAISDISVVNERAFHKIFDLGWESLDEKGHEKGWKLLYKLIERADNKLTEQFFEKYDASKFDNIQHKRFKHLIEVFEEYEYYREQAEEAARRHYEEQFET